ncbi:MAG: helix-turn-helix domain-containing protein [Blastochloris sp.]|nr:helix-turn-helix domain-containing protein [Blastochloris sp.]
MGVEFGTWSKVRRFPVEQEYFTVNEIAERAKVTRTTVYDWMNSGALRFVFVGRHRRIPLSAWLEFVRPGNPGESTEEERRDQKNLTPAAA